MSIKKVEVKYPGNNGDRIDFDIPNLCPHCGKTMVPEITNSYTDNNKSGYSRVCLNSRCTDGDCRKFFSLEYQIYYGLKKGYNYSEFSSPELIEYTYNPPIEVSLPDQIEKVSPSFKEIYTQAAEAESLKLNQIAGVGYRKAAEFLIKDYVIMKNPKDIDKIKSMLLGQVISEHLKDFPKIQSLAKASAWIGNDETHYVRVHTDKDITDLKRFILSTAQFIAADYHADVAIELTSKQK